MNKSTRPPSVRTLWRLAKQRVAHSIKLRMVLVFLLLAGAMTFVFLNGAQKAFTMGWRETARPLLIDYVDHLLADVTAGGASPQLARAVALTERLPLTLRIEGPAVNWASHPEQDRPHWMRGRDDGEQRRDDWNDDRDWPRILKRQTADGHTVEFGINGQAFERRPHLVGFALAALLVLTLLAWLYVRRLLRPLDAIGAGARRFGSGDFSQPIAERFCQAHDELGELAVTINTMGHDIHQMLEAKRSLLLAISHELRSPLTRARLNTELLPEQADTQAQREALLRDLQEMAALISDLLESERLASRHAALQREALDLPTLACEVLEELKHRYPQAAAAPVLQADVELPVLHLDAARMRLLLRNLLDNALRHSHGASLPPELHIRACPPEGGHGPGIEIGVRDHGPGVPEAQLAHLAEPFFRTDAARTRSAGGVGLGLHLCQLVARAHGGDFSVRNVQPGLVVSVRLPGARLAGG